MVVVPSIRVLVMATATITVTLLLELILLLVVVAAAVALCDHPFFFSLFCWVQAYPSSSSIAMTLRLDRTGWVGTGWLDQ